MPLPGGAAEHAGTYRHPGYGTVSVHLEGDSLTVHRSDQSSGVRLVSSDIFEATPREWTSVWAPGGNPARIQFSRDFQGRVTGLRISSAGTITFERVASH